MPNIAPVNSETSYEAALARSEILMDAELNTPEGDELDILLTLIVAYEDRVYPMKASDPISAIEYTMDQKGFNQSDLAKLIGKSRASDILNRKRGLSRSQAITLYNEWGVSAESLLSA
uniref:HTH cro/C1-type domain-containing protein n=1 Tax=OCS116 cluster bacterium TaxID=2030921 RepID=A0A2A4YTV7_9PROT